MENVVIFYKETKVKKVGFTVSKKIGNAVKRNFAKRRLRALFYEIEEFLKEGTYIFVAKKDIVNSKYGYIKSSVIRALKKLKVYRE